MAALILPGRLTRQPSGFGRVDWSNPLSRDLRVLTATLGGAQFEAVVGAPVLANTGRSDVAFGGAVTTYTAGQQTTFSHNASYDVLGSVTLVTLFKINSLTNYSHLISKNSGSSSNLPYELRASNSSGDGSISFTRANAAGFTSWSPGSSLAAGVFHSVAVTQATSIDTTPTFYVNGASIAGSSSGTGTGAATSNGGLLYLGQRGDAVTKLDGQVLFAAVWARVLSAAEVASVVSKPWQLLAAPQRRIWVAASSGTSASSATTDGADVLAANVGPVVAAASANADGADALAASVGPVIGASSGTTDGADVLSAAAGVAGVGLSAAVTDGADSLSAAVGPVVGVSLATTDGADVLAASGGIAGVGAATAVIDGADGFAAAASALVAAASATNDGADQFTGAVSPVVGAQSVTADGPDLLVAAVDTGTVPVGAAVAAQDGADYLAALLSNGSAAGGYYGKKRYQIKVGNRVIEGPREVVEQIAADLVAKSEPVEVAEIIVPAKRNKPAIVVKTDIVPKAKAVAPEWDDEQDEEEIMALLLA